MILKNLRLKNFRSHKDTSIDFESLKSPILIKGINKDTGGSNGAGKSTILDGIEYALYGKDPLVLREGTDSGLVEIVFVHDNITYKISRMISKDTYTVDLYENDILKSSSKGEIDTYIRKVLKISKGLFDQTIFQAQGFSGFFGALSPKMKADFILELLDINKWNTYHSVGKSLLSDLSSAITKIKVERGMRETNVTNFERDLSSMNIDKITKSIKFLEAAMENKNKTLSEYSEISTIMDQNATIQARFNSTEKEMTSLKNELTAAKELLSRYNTIMTDLKSRMVSAVDENYKSTLMASYLGVEKHIASIEHEITLKTKAVDSYTKTMRGLLSAQQCPMCLKPINAEEIKQLTTHVDLEIQKRNTEMEELRQKIKYFTDKRKQDSLQLENLNKQAMVYTEQISTKKDLEFKISSTTDTISRIENRLKELSPIFSSLKEQYAIINKSENSTIRKQIELLRADIEDMKTKLTPLYKRMAEYNASMKYLTEEKNMLSELDGLLIKYAKAEKILRSVVSLFSQNGIQRWMFTKALSEISALTNSLLNATGLSVVFQMEKHKKSGDGYKATFDILVRKGSGGALYALKYLSGGEKAAVNFAIRLAFSTIMATKYGFKFMVIDEGFADMDPKAREIVGDMIKLLSDQFQIFVVTHFNDFEDMFDQVLLVEKENNISRIVA